MQHVDKIGIETINEKDVNTRDCYPSPSLNQPRRTDYYCHYHWDKYRSIRCVHLLLYRKNAWCYVHIWIPVSIRLIQLDKLIKKYEDALGSDHLIHCELGHVVKPIWPCGFPLQAGVSCGFPFSPGGCGLPVVGLQSRKRQNCASAWCVADRTNKYKFVKIIDLFLDSVPALEN